MKMDVMETEDLEKRKIADVPTKKLLKLKMFIIKENPGNAEKESLVDKFLKTKISQKFKKIMLEKD